MFPYNIFFRGYQSLLNGLHDVNCVEACYTKFMILPLPENLFQIIFDLQFMLVAN